MRLRLPCIADCISREQPRVWRRKRRPAAANQTTREGYCPGQEVLEYLHPSVPHFLRHSPMLSFRSRRVFSLAVSGLATTAATPTASRSPGYTFDMESTTTTQAGVV